MEFKMLLQRQKIMHDEAVEKLEKLPSYIPKDIVATAKDGLSKTNAILEAFVVHFDARLAKLEQKASERS